MACAVTPFKSQSAAPQGGTVVLQISDGSRVSMPFMRPPPGVSEQGNPEIHAEAEPIDAVLPEDLPEPDTESAQGPHTEPEIDPQPDTAQAEAQEPGPQTPNAERPPSEAMTDAAPELAPAEPLESAAQVPVEREAWGPMSPPWTRPDAVAETERGAEAQPPFAGTPPTRNAPAGQTPATPASLADSNETSPEADRVAHAEVEAEESHAERAMPAVAPVESLPPAENEDRSDAPAPTQTDTEAQQVFGEDDVDQPIRFDEQVRPTPSAISRRRNETGTVVVLIRVDAEGELDEIRVLDDAGHPRLLDVALQALRQSTFTPATRGGEPVTSTRRVEYRF